LQVGTLAGTSEARPSAGDPAGYVLDGAQHVIYRGADSLIHELFWTSQNGWQTGTLATVAGAAAAAGDPAAYTLGGTRHVVYVGTDDTIHELWWSAQAGWQIGRPQRRAGDYARDRPTRRLCGLTATSVQVAGPVSIWPSRSIAPPPPGATSPASKERNDPRA
jgi:hypothetical protein